MSTPKSKVYKNKQFHVEVMANSIFKEEPDAVGRIEFFSGMVRNPNLIFVRSSLAHFIALKEPTARALANNILRQCDEIKKGS